MGSVIGHVCCPLPCCLVWLTRNFILPHRRTYLLCVWSMLSDSWQDMQLDCVSDYNRFSENSKPNLEDSYICQLTIFSSQACDCYVELMEMSHTDTQKTGIAWKTVASSSCQTPRCLLPSLSLVLCRLLGLVCYCPQLPCMAATPTLTHPSGIWVVTPSVSPAVRRKVS